MVFFSIGSDIMAFPQFVDIAKFQPSNAGYFKSLRRHGAVGAFVQLNYGNGYPNPDASAQLTNSLKYLKFTGCYAFFLGSPVSEAHYFLWRIKLYGMDKSTPVMLDVEANQSYNGPQTHLINEWTRIVYNAGFHNIWIYSMGSWLKDGYHIKPENLKHGHIWAAAYGTDKPGVNNASAWQYTDNWHGLHTDGDYLFKPLSCMTGQSIKPKLKHKVIKKYKPTPQYLTKGGYFEAISDLNGYYVTNLKKKNGDFLPKGSRFHGIIVSDGQVTRIKTGLGYYSGNKKFVKAI